MALKVSFLYGIRWGTWRRLLRDNRFDLDGSGWINAALISLFAIQNSLMSRRDDRLDLDDVPVEPPIFLLGHWRSGTTHLHYLLDQDPDLSAPTNYQCAFPHSFIHSERRHRRWLERFAPRERPQDSMEFGLDLPGEDEMALAQICLLSPYLGWAFPRSEDRYRKYLSFARATEEERRTFRDALALFVRKLSYRYRRSIVLKSPGHTARIPLLLETFPDARFVLITRHPYEVFQSSLYFYRSWQQSFAFLQAPVMQDLEERVLSLYEEMYAEFLAHEPSLPRDRYHVIRYEDLRAEPLARMRRLYEGIGLDGFPEAALREYLSRIAGYRPNPYPALEARWKDIVAERWAPTFDKWGYAK